MRPHTAPAAFRLTRAAFGEAEALPFHHQWAAVCLFFVPCVDRSFLTGAAACIAPH